MDEPTATLTPGETQALFALMARLKADGVTIVYISHKLDEVERVTDEVIVMRDGRFVARAPTATLTRHQMANLMVGPRTVRPVPAERSGARGRRGAVAHGRRTSSVPGWAQDVSFDVRAGRDPRLRRPGRRGAHRAVRRPAGPARAHRVQRVTVDGRAVRLRSPRDAADAGLTYLSEDRKGNGLHVRLRPAREPHADGAAALRAGRGSMPHARACGAGAGGAAISASAPAAPSCAPRRCRAATSRSSRSPRCCTRDPRVRRARRADARRRRRRQARHLLPDPAARRARGARVIVDLVRADRADRPVPPRRGDARRPHPGRRSPAEQLTEEELIAHATGTRTDAARHRRRRAAACRGAPARLRADRRAGACCASPARCSTRDFATLDNALNVLTRTAFIGIIAVGMCFVIISGGIDLSVGSMAALIAGCVILLMNALGEAGLARRAAGGGARHGASPWCWARCSGWRTAC